MPIGHTSGLVFIGRPPWIFQATSVVAIVNLFTGLGIGIWFERWKPAGFSGYPPCRALQNGDIQCHVPAGLCWYIGDYVRISLYLLGLLFALCVIYRNQLRITMGG
jgi:hypothetical protein